MRNTLQHITFEGLQQLAKRLDCADRFRFSHRHVTIKPEAESRSLKWIILAIGILLVVGVATWSFIIDKPLQILAVAGIVALFIYFFNYESKGRQEVSVDLETRQFIFVQANSLFPRKKEQKRFDIDTVERVELREVGSGRHTWFRIGFYDLANRQLICVDFAKYYPEDFIAKKLHSFFELVLRENKKIKEKINSQ